MKPIFPNSPYNKYYHFYNNVRKNSTYFKPEEYFSNNIYINKTIYQENIDEDINDVKDEKIKKNSSSGFNFNFLNFENFFIGSSDEPIFEFMGIKLYLDDLLILGLLFILYTEGVEDEMLFLSLILLIIG